MKSGPTPKNWKPKARKHKPAKGLELRRILRQVNKRQAVWPIPFKGYFKTI